MANQDTWEKIIRLGKKRLKKKQILNYYAKLWKNDKLFRKLVTSEGVFVRAVYKNKPVIKRRKIKIESFEDLKELIKNHAVEFHIPQKTLQRKHNMFSIDIDVPEKMWRSSVKTRLLHSLLGHLSKNKKIKVRQVVRTPRGYHLFVSGNKREVKKTLKPAVQDIPSAVFGKRKGNSIVIDLNEPNTAIPGSLSVHGGKYEILKKGGRMLW